MKKLRRDKNWREFQDWCADRRLRPLPAHPWTVAVFIKWCGGRYDMSAIRARLKSIARAHLLHRRGAPGRHAIVARTLRRLEIRAESDGARADLFEPPAFAAAPPAKPARRDSRPRPKWKRVMRAKPRLVRRR